MKTLKVAITIALLAVSINSHAFDWDQYANEARLDEIEKHQKALEEKMKTEQVNRDFHESIRAEREMMDRTMDEVNE